MSDKASRPEPPLGWIVTLSTPRAGDGTPLMKVYYVAISDQTEALDAVKASAGVRPPGAEIVAHQPISESLISALSMKPGDIVQW
jgi:hypothetical protein